MPRSGSEKLWNSSITTAKTWIEVERFGVQQAVEQNLGDDDEDFGIRVFPAIARHQADVGLGEPPADGARLHLAELLFGQRDQRRGVVHRPAGVQRFERGRLGDERFAGARRSADQNAGLGGEPSRAAHLPAPDTACTGAARSSARRDRRGKYSWTQRTCSRRFAEALSSNPQSATIHSQWQVKWTPVFGPAGANP